MMAGYPDVMLTMGLYLIFLTFGYALKLDLTFSGSQMEEPETINNVPVVVIKADDRWIFAAGTYNVISPEPNVLVYGYRSLNTVTSGYYW